MTKGQKIYGIILAVISAVAYGAYPIFTRYTQASGLNNSTVLFLRFFICILCLWAYCLLKGRKVLHAPRKAVVSLLLLGMVAYASMSALYLASLFAIPVSLACLLLCSYPVFVALFSVLLGRERGGWLLVVSLAVCILGLCLVLNVEVGTLSLAGVLLALGASIAYALYVLGGSLIEGDVHPVLRATLIMSGACISYAVYGFLSGGIQLDFQPAGWGWITCMAVVATVIPSMAFWAAIEKTGALNTSIIGILEPLSTAILSVFILGETLNFLQIIGIVIVLCGILIVQIPQFRAMKEKD